MCAGAARSPATSAARSSGAAPRRSTTACSMPVPSTPAIIAPPAVAQRREVGGRPACECRTPGDAGCPAACDNAAMIATRRSFWRTPAARARARRIAGRARRHAAARRGRRRAAAGRRRGGARAGAERPRRQFLPARRAARPHGAGQLLGDLVRALRGRDAVARPPARRARRRGLRGAGGERAGERGAHPPVRRSPRPRVPGAARSRRQRARRLGRAGVPVDVRDRSPRPRRAGRDRRDRLGRRQDRGARPRGDARPRRGAGRDARRAGAPGKES